MKKKYLHKAFERYAAINWTCSRHTLPGIVMRWISIFYAPAGGVFSFHSLNALPGCLARTSVFCCNPRRRISIDAPRCWAAVKCLQSVKSKDSFLKTWNSRSNRKEGPRMWFFTLISQRQFPAMQRSGCERPEPTWADLCVGAMEPPLSQYLPL